MGFCIDPQARELNRGEDRARPRGREGGVGVLGVRSMRGAKTDIVSIDWHVLECNRPTATEHC